MGLFDLFGKKTTKNNFGQRMDRLTAKGELPYGWIYANRDFTTQVENEYGYLLNTWDECRDKTPKERYAAAKSLLSYMNDVKKICENKGECFVCWRKIQFTDKDIADIASEVEYVKEHYNKLNEKYKRQIYIEQTVIPKLKTELPKIIKETPGILQTEVYKLYPEDYKDYISYELYGLARDGIITREKSGRTYSLKLK